MSSKAKERVSRDELFFEIAESMAKRSTCPRAHVGSVAVKDGRIIVTGYNGAVSGMPHCYEVGCAEHVVASHENSIGDIELHCTRSVHAEANIVAWAARAGVLLEGADVYTTHQPCLPCSKLLINAGVRAVHFSTGYGNDDSLELLRESEVLVFHGITPTS